MFSYSCVSVDSKALSLAKSKGPRGEESDEEDPCVRGAGRVETSHRRERRLRRQGMAGWLSLSPPARENTL